MCCGEASCVLTRPQLRARPETAVRWGCRHFPGAVPGISGEELHRAIEAWLGGWSGGWGYDDGVLRELTGCGVELEAVDGVAVGVVPVTTNNLSKKV